MTKSKIDINEILLKAHKLGVKNAIDLAARTGVRLVVCENGKIKQIKPNYKYVRVAVGPSRNKKSANLSRKK